MLEKFLNIHKISYFSLLLSIETAEAVQRSHVFQSMLESQNACRKNKIKPGNTS